MSKPPAAFTHEWIWTAIDTLASRRGLAPSGLAKLAGLDPTTFNRSKRFTPEGRPRWPSTESIAKVLEATGTPLDEFAMLELGTSATSHAATSAKSLEAVPLVGEVRDAAIGGLSSSSLLDFAGRRQLRRSTNVRCAQFAFSVADGSLEPAYSQGNTLIASIAEMAKSGDRVVVQPLTGRAVPGLLLRSTRSKIELADFRPGRDALELSRADVRWIARIIWARQ